MMRLPLYLLPLLLCLASKISRVDSHLEWIGPGNPLPGKPAPVGSVWPKPTKHLTTPYFFVLDTSKFSSRVFQKGKDYVCDPLTFARHHYQELIRDLKGKYPGNVDTGIIISMDINVKKCGDPGDYPQIKDPIEEEYELIVEAASREEKDVIVTLNAPRAWGAIRGLETFYQLIWFWSNGDGMGHFRVNQTRIRDKPRFIHRGLMVDTSRHFLPEKKILEILNAMMYNKLNVFHWHVTDDQSFPFVSRRFPELSEKGAYSESFTYPPSSVLRIKDAARIRGIRVIMEFDTPGHVGGFGKSFPELLTPCSEDPLKNNDLIVPITPSPGEGTRTQRASRENFDPSNPNVYYFMEEFLKEIVMVSSPEMYLHLGFDEVYPLCWWYSPRIQRFMERYNYTDMSEVQGHYMKRILQIVRKLGVTPIVWQDPLDENVELDKDVIIQIWKDSPFHINRKYQTYIKNGYKVILSSCWYINYIKYGEAWKEYYECDPINGTDIEGYEENVIGGEAAIWSEYVDQTNIIARLFPSASATAEVLWSQVRDVADDAMWRLDQFRCSMLRRGIRAQPILPGYCGDFENSLEA